MRFRRLLLHAPVLLLTAASFAQTSNHPLNHKDYDGWRSISAQRLSGDGRFLAYGLFPQQGDGEVVIRNLVTGQESRYPAGALPPPPATPDLEEGPPPPPRAAIIQFSADSHTVTFSTFAPKAEIDKAKKEKKPADQMPKDDMVIVDLVSGRATRMDRIKGFAMPEKANGFLAYLHETPETKQADKADEGQKKAGEPEANTASEPTRRGPARGTRTEFGGDLVLRNLADSSERNFANVMEFALTDDGTQLLYAVSGRDAENNGVFMVKTGTNDTPIALLSGRGKYVKLTWDEDQTTLAFLSDRGDSASKQPKWKLYGWDRQAPQATQFASASTPGFRKE